MPTGRKAIGCFHPFMRGGLYAWIALCTFDAFARLIPTAPVNAWPVLPAVQKRPARHVAVLEIVSYEPPVKVAARLFYGSPFTIRRVSNRRATLPRAALPRASRRR